MDLSKIKVWLATVFGGAIPVGLTFALEVLEEFKAAAILLSVVLTGALTFINWKKDE